MLIYRVHYFQVINAYMKLLTQNQKEIVHVDSFILTGIFQPHSYPDLLKKVVIIHGKCHPKPKANREKGYSHESLWRTNAAAANCDENVAVSDKLRSN